MMKISLFLGALILSSLASPVAVNNEVGRIDAAFLRELDSARVDTAFLRDIEEAKIDTIFLREVNIDKVDTAFLRAAESDI
ncbi:hypothetical protein CVT25_009662 [Psilocybe cyanescens]|uniref:Uncharacterized protein n=1 Tax=Psilocybe cyanescens TaxID=93625 RepID=A0A409XGY6_PSICY|nr:hypothetical protein CVT25_009662 [Psilocybe cyanescens]